MYEKIKNWLDSMKVANILINPELIRYTFTKNPFKISDNRKVSKKLIKNLNEKLKQAVFAFSIKSLKNGDLKSLENSITKSYSLARDLRRYSKRFKVYLIGNSHIDIAWLWRIAETVQVSRNTFKTVIKNMIEYPELTYAQGSAITYKWIEERYPDLFEKIKKRVKQGRWEIVGGTWVEPDCNLISGESWIRQILYGKKYFKKSLGVDVNIGWNPDSFGYNWNMPQLYKKSGYDYFVTQKIWWNDTTVFPYYIFWWKGVDGTKLLSYFPPDSYTSRVELFRVSDNIGKYEATTGYKKSLILYGIGDHGGGPNREILNRVRKYKKLFIAPEFIHSRAIDFLKKIKKDLKNNIPVYNNELYLQYHRGTYTTQAEIKKNNRKSESMLSRVEKITSISSLLGFDYPFKRLQKAWEMVLTNQFHDILPGSSITPVYRDAVRYYKKAYMILNGILERSFGFLNTNIKTTSKGKPILVFNTLSWNRKDYVNIEINGNYKGYRLVNDRGEEVKTKINYCYDRNKTNLGFLAKDIPSLGFKIYYLIKGKNSIQERKPNGFVFENKYYKMKINDKTGNISSLYDKINGFEIVAKGKEINELKVYEDRPERWDAWNIGYTGRVWKVNRLEEIEVVESNDIRTVIKVKKSFLGLDKERYSPTEDFPSSFFTQYIILYKDLDRIDIKNVIDWWEDHCMLKVEFPININSDYAYYEIPYATIKRTAKFNTLEERAMFEVSAHRWADYSDDKRGFAILNNGKYGYDIHNGVVKLSLLKSPTWPDKVADRGVHEFTYSIYTHRGNWNESDVVKRGYELNNPLVIKEIKTNKKGYESGFSFFNLSNNTVILDTIKKSEDNKGYILRFYEPYGKNTSVVLKTFKQIKEVYETNLMEKELRKMKSRGKEVELKFKKYEIKTIKIIF